ncbi:hypothetical protein ABPG77_002478 [Micractinium sp. CCAP 211/92]
MPWAVRNNYNFSLSRQHMLRGLVSHGGDGARARRALARLASGQPIRVAFMGGSITIGTGSSKIGETDYVSTVFRWIRETFPHPDHQLVNGAVGGVPSSYFSVCAEWHMPENPDLVVLETNVNDGGKERGDTPIRRAHERLIRKLLNLPSHPAVAELLYYRAEPDMHLHFRSGGDDELVTLGIFYRPGLSARQGRLAAVLAKSQWRHRQRSPSRSGPQVDGRPRNLLLARGAVQLAAPPAGA